ncbi:MAG: twin-arginine translocation signal domain-containing protein [Verrucomicrobia bacterium]|nr:MAG: twin-arginine translocation signal domain-containing protein [Verrucomicrobiota bacterium]
MRRHLYRLITFITSTRRDFLKFAGCGATAAAVAGCTISKA